MAAKLRKMLGDINAPVTIAMMRLLETQSQRTLTDWSESWCRRHYLPIYEEYAPGDGCVLQLLDLTRGYLQGNAALKDVKAQIKAVRTRCGELTDPIAVAAARAVSTGCAACTTATGSLGFQFYGAAAIAYTKAGLNAAAETYNALAEEHMQQALADLQAIAVPDEPNPARIDWNC